ncbi:MAG: c-type cytochrome domain-containing protein, partial [Prosthecobacter sp.]|nr:c-type cytochrome domain-containing protein [Prosthecobacter sp.]
MTLPHPILPLLCLAYASAQAVDFKKDIQPILEKNCYECHSEKTGKKKAGFVFDDLTTFIKDINPKGIVVPGSPGESHMFEVITNRSHEHTMPPDESLSPKDIDKLREWIEAGASLEKDGPKIAFVK